MSALKKPVQFGKYYLLERINVGGMAEVFKAKTFGVEGFERLLAVKRILPNIAEDEEFITMFIDEAKIAVQLQHANIAQIFDLGKVDDSYFIALEYLHGRDLRSIFDRMRNKGEALPIAMACYVTMQVCEGLDYAHNKRDAQGRELNLVHRDISPQNVLIGYEGECKLIDFGIAKAAGKASKTQAGILKGKFGYMSPEQVRGLPIDKRSDIFAVGIVLYELLTGERLFIGESDFSTLEKVRNVEITPPSSYNKKIPAELERVVLKALARDPDDRYANAIDLHDDLQSFLYSVGEFFSRKDLAAWMKKTFAMEIEEDNAKLEEFRQVAPPVASAEVSRRAAVAGLPAPRVGAGGGGAVAKGGAAAKPPPKPPANPPSGHPPMGWDDEELDTQIFDKEEVKPVAAEDLFFEDDDRTVANEPAPDILEQARPPELLTPKPITLTPLPSEDIKMTPPPLARPLPPPPAMRRPTLVGVPPASKLPTPMGVGGLAPSLPPPGPPPGRNTNPNMRRSGLNLPAVNVPPAQQHHHTQPARRPTPVPPPQRFHTAHEPAPFGSGSFDVMSSKKPARRGVAVLGAVAVVAIVGMVYWYNSRHQAGADRADDDARGRDRPDRQRQGGRPFAGLDREAARAVHALGHARRLCAQRPEHRAEGGAAADAGRGAGAVAGHRLRVHQRPAGTSGLVRRRGGQGELRAAGADAVPGVAHRPGTPRARDPGREPLQTLEGTGGDRPRRDQEDSTRRSFPPSGARPAAAASPRRLRRRRRRRRVGNKRPRWDLRLRPGHRRRPPFSLRLRPSRRVVGRRRLSRAAARRRSQRGAAVPRHRRRARPGAAARARRR